MQIIKIYGITITDAPTAAENGVFFSLLPWDEDTQTHKGYDDGGVDYILPDKYHVAENGIYRNDNGEHVKLAEQYKAPVLHDITGKKLVILNEADLVFNTGTQLFSKRIMVMLRKVAAIITNQNNTAGISKLDIVTNSKFTLWAGICMIAALLSSLASLLSLVVKYDDFMVLSIVSAYSPIITYISFIIIVFLPKKNVKLFMVPIGLSLLVPLIFDFIPLIQYLIKHIFLWSYTALLDLFPSITYLWSNTALFVLFLLIALGSIRKKPVATVSCGIIAAIIFIRAMSSITYNGVIVLFNPSHILFFISYFLLSFGLDNNPNPDKPEF